MVPGIEPSLDKMLQGRLFSYPDTHRHRLGVNYLQIPINCPYMTKVSNYLRDGPANVNGNQGSAPNYEPNSFNGPIESKKHANPPFKVSGIVGKTRTSHKKKNSDYAQPNALFSKVMTDTDREHLIGNIAVHLKKMLNNLFKKGNAKYFIKLILNMV